MGAFPTGSPLLSPWLPHGVFGWPCPLPDPRLLFLSWPAAACHHGQGPRLTGFSSSPRPFDVPRDTHGIPADPEGGGSRGENPNLLPSSLPLDTAEIPLTVANAKFKFQRMATWAKLTSFLLRLLGHFRARSPGGRPGSLSELSPGSPGAPLEPPLFRFPECFSRCSSRSGG